MRNTYLTGLSIGIIILGVILGVGYWVVGNVDNYNEQQTKSEVKEPATEGTSYGSAEEERKAQTGYIGGIEYTIDPAAFKNEKSVIDVMHKMTHQKVSAEEKWGAIPMTVETVNAVYEIVSNSNFEKKADMVEILKKWKNEDFNSVDNDHNYFWGLQGGTVGKAYGTLNYEEELEFIHNNFDVKKNN